MKAVLIAVAVVCLVVNATIGYYWLSAGDERPVDAPEGDLLNVDLGEMRTGGIKEGSIRLVNRSETAVSLSRVKTTCSCIKAEVVPLTIPAGGYAVFNYAVRAPVALGPFAQDVQFEYAANSAGLPRRVRMTGMVGAWITLSTHLVNLNCVAGRPTEARVELSVEDGSAPVVSCAIDGLKPALVASPVSKDRMVCTLVYSPPAALAAGTKLSGMLTVAHGRDSDKIVSIPVSVTHLSGLVVRPTQFLLSDMDDRAHSAAGRCLFL